MSSLCLGIFLKWNYYYALLLNGAHWMQYWCQYWGALLPLTRNGGSTPRPGHSILYEICVARTELIYFVAGDNCQDCDAPSPPPLGLSRHNVRLIAIAAHTNKHWVCFMLGTERILVNIWLYCYVLQCGKLVQAWSFKIHSQAMTSLYQFPIRRNVWWLRFRRQVDNWYA